MNPAVNPAQILDSTVTLSIDQTQVYIPCDPSSKHMHTHTHMHDELESPQ